MGAVFFKFNVVLPRICMPRVCNVKQTLTGEIYLVCPRIARVYAGDRCHHIAFLVSVPFVPCVIFALPTVSALFASSSPNGNDKNFCLFVHVTWLSANSLLYAGGGGGSVIFVIKYAVDASATP